MCGTLTCETNGSCDVSVSVGASPLDITTILNGTVSYLPPTCLDQQLSWGVPLLPHISIELPSPGESNNGNKTTNITKQHNYDKVTDIWARWYTANTNTKSQSALEIHEQSQILAWQWLYNGWFLLAWFPGNTIPQQLYFENSLYTMDTRSFVSCRI